VMTLGLPRWPLFAWYEERLEGLSVADTEFFGSIVAGRGIPTECDMVVRVTDLRSEGRSVSPGRDIHQGSPSVGGSPEPSPGGPSDAGIVARRSEHLMAGHHPHSFLWQ
jgi:hypothetical protein